MTIATDLKSSNVFTKATFVTEGSKSTIEYFGMMSPTVNLRPIDVPQVKKNALPSASFLTPLA